MKSNKDLQLDFLNNKYYFIGFTIGIIPYVFILILAFIFKASHSFVELLFLFTIITGLINGHVFKKYIQSK